MAEKYLNKKQELFAKFMAEGSTQLEAYELAGYEPSSANASTLANKPLVRKRIAELKAEHERKEAEFKVLAQRAEEADPTLAAEIAFGAEWNFQRVMDMMGANVRLAQIAGEYKAANECLKMMGEAMKMFADAKAKQAANDATGLPGSLALIKNLTQIMGEQGTPDCIPAPEEEETEPANPVRPRRGRKSVEA